MSIKQVLMIAAGLLSATSLVQADVTWEHEATVRWSAVNGNKPLAKAKIFNNWTPQRHRLLMKYSVPSDLENPRYNQTGSAAIIHRLDDDRLIGYSSEEKAFISEERSPLLEKVRLNVWKGWKPELADEPAPSLTPEQRRRLGAELRATYEPFTTEVFKPYFRPLPKTRLLNDRLARGYRMTWLMNTGDEYIGDSWGRVSFEWWIAPHETSDDEISNYYQSALAPLRKPGGLTNSMWLNEMLPVLWAALPRPFQQSLATMQVPDGAEDAFSGVPLRIYMTMQPPTDGIDMGVVRAEIALKNRHTNPVPASVWEAPAGYRHIGHDDVERQMQETFENPLMQQAMRQAIVASAGAVNAIPPVETGS